MKYLPVCIAACFAAVGFSSGIQTSFAAQEIAAQQNFSLMNDPLTTAGPLKKISDAQNLFELKTVGTKLETKIASSNQEAQESVSQIRSLTGTGGGSSSSGNGNWTAYFQGNNFFGHVSKGQMAAHMLARFPNMQAANSDSEFSILFKELNSPQRELAIGVDDDNAFDISLRSSELGYLFRFRQEKSGRIVCQEICSEFVFARSASSFDEFSKQNPVYVQERLMQVLDFIGAERPKTRYSSVVRNQVLVMLRPISEDRMSRFKKAVEKMSASSYSDRESATSEIEKKFEHWQDLIEIGMGDEDFAVETRMRLRKIHDNQVDKASKELMKLAQTSKLHMDAEYLIWVLGKTESDADKMVLVKQLSKLTEQDFELDAAKCIAWFEENQKPKEVATKKIERTKIIKQTGPIDSVSEFVQQLVKFTNDNGDLKLDRAHWGQPFGNQPIEDSVAEVEELMKKHNLPLGWLEAGGKHSLTATEYPQVIFANMTAKLESEDKKADARRLTYGYINQADLVSRNRVANNGNITAQMQFHKESGKARFGRLVLAGDEGKTPAAKYFYLYFKERTDAKRVLEIFEAEDRTISITVISDSADTVIRMVQHPVTKVGVPAESRCIIYDIRGDQTREFSAANFKDLVQGNAEYFKNEWVPLMEKFGIQIEIPNAESKSDLGQDSSQH